MNVNAPKVSAPRRLACELVEVELEPREEHEEEDPEVAERLDDALALDPVEDDRARRAARRG